MMLKRIGLGIAAFLLVSLTMLGLFVYGQLHGWFTKEYALPELVEILKPHIKEFRAEAPDDAPRPAVLLFPGCGGMRGSYEDYAALAATEGVHGYVVNSYAARGLSDTQARLRVCSGQTLWGRERAGDVAAAIAHVRSLPHVDRKRIVLMGWSHGAWSIMDLLAMHSDLYYPSNLDEPPPASLVRSVRGAILFYPYCGMLSLSPGQGWEHRPPTLMLIARNDWVVNSRLCIRLAGDLEEDGVPVTMKVYEEAGHAFDQPNVTANYRPELAADARARVSAFLRGIGDATDEAPE